MKRILPVLLVLLSLKSIEGTFDPVKELAERRVLPWLVNHLLFEKISSFQ